MGLLAVVLFTGLLVLWFVDLENSQTTESPNHKNQQTTMWKEEDNQLRATFNFTNFVQAFAFMTEVAFHAEKLAHHPEWSNVYNTVKINLSTHDAGNKVTAKDHELARAITQVYRKFSL